MTGKTVITLLVLALYGCAWPEPTACQGLVYKEAGLGRREYLPCAKAMVAELDRFHNELKTMGDKTLAIRDRQKAHMGCLASNARLVKLVQQAGGRQKLAYVQWEDVTLNRLNWNIIQAQTAYLVACYYGVATAEKFGVAQEDPSHVEARTMLAQLR
jgi:hypothetical protein